MDGRVLATDRTNGAVLTPTECGLGSPHAGGAGMPVELEAILASPAVELQRTALARVGRRIEPAPILWKYLTRSALRVIFEVSGGQIEEGGAVSIAVLHDPEAARTLYAHAMYAGPEVNPLLKHTDGPMAVPKAQRGLDGDRATRRMIEHKRALWRRFGTERRTIGAREAGRRWRESYYWSLRRLYFCSQCPRCKWGHAYFDGPVGAVSGETPCDPTFGGARVELSREEKDMVAVVVGSASWQIEKAYARRGGFGASDTPRLIQGLEGGCQQVVFPTDARLLRGGCLVGVAVTYDGHTEQVLHAECLSFGPEAEAVFLHGETGLGLPLPQPGEDGLRARRAYVSWRRDAWTRFWLDDLEMGLSGASWRWLESFWPALERLFGGNRLRGPVA